MKKRFIRLFMFVTVIASMGALNSCKDYDEDRYNDLQYKLQEQAKGQQAALEALKADFDAKLAAIKQCNCDPQNVQDMINAALANAKAGLTPEEVADMIAKALANYDGLTTDEVEGIVNNSLKNYATLTQLENAKKELNDALANIQNALDNKADQEALDLANQAILDLQSRVGEAETLASENKEAIKELSDLVNTLVIKDWSADIEEIRTTATEAKTKAEDNYILIVGLQEAYEKLQAEIEALEVGANPDLVNTVDSLVNVSKNLATKEDIEETKDYAYYLYTLLAKRIEVLEKDLAALEQKVEDYRTELLEMIEDLRTDLNSMITSIIVQGTKNPVYGYFAMPGVDPNLLIAYYGENEHITYFPTVSTSDLVYEENALTEKDAEMLNGTVDTWNVAGGSTLIDDEGNAGKLYLTINPNTVDFTGQEVKLVNSLGKESPIKLSPLAASTDKMTFGWTRADNGFYEAKATLSEDDIEAAKIRFDLDAMQADVEDAIKSKSASSLKGIAKSIYNQLGDMMDANGVMASWTDTEDTKHSIYSQYSIGAAAIKPLSFSFLKGVGMSIPFVSNLSEYTDLNKYIDVTKFNIDFKTIDADFDIKVQFDKIYVGTDGKAYAHFYMDGTDLKEAPEGGVVCLDMPLDKQTQDIINNRADVWSAQMEKEFKTQLQQKLTDMVNDINDMTAEINGKLQNKAQDVLDKAQNALDSKISKVESLFSRLNNVLSNPNGKLQVCMLYDGEDGEIHQMSNSFTFPTHFTGNGAITIYPTTYTLELAAPSYKKFIAVTNVFKDGESAQGGNTECKSVLDATNEATNFNEVISGSYKGIEFQPSAAGYKYEIFYSALDFSGKISQHKFYVEVQ